MKHIQACIVRQSPWLGLCGGLALLVAMNIALAELVLYSHPGNVVFSSLEGLLLHSVVCASLLRGAVARLSVT